MFEEERGLIPRTAGDLIVAIEHIGSTAVPDLGGKPSIGIMPAVRSLVHAERCIEPLEGIGYEYVPEYNEVIPERRYFHQGPPQGRTHHLHVVERPAISGKDICCFGVGCGRTPRTRESTAS
jgi:GrpB-like predicted nucleotidyltransferase (UPF0157 family)